MLSKGLEGVLVWKNAAVSELEHRVVSVRRVVRTGSTRRWHCKR